MAESSDWKKKPVKPVQDAPAQEKKPFIPVKPFVNPSSFNKSWYGWKSGWAKPPILKHSRSR
jgi:hypothetical protein